MSPPLHAGVAHVQSHLQNVLDDALVQLLRLVTGRFHVTHVVSGSHVQLVRVPDVGVPSNGVISVGEVAKTSAQLPVSFVTAVARFADVGVARNVAIHVASPLTQVDIGNPVQLVSVQDEGVQSAGVTKEGLVALTGAQLHVAVVHTGKADAPHQTRTSVVAQLARVCCDQVAVVPVAISEYAVVPVLLPVPQSVTATSVHPGA